MGLFSKSEKKESGGDSDSVYSVDSKFSDLPNPKTYLVYRNWKSLKTIKVIKHVDKSPAYYSEFHYNRPSSLKEKFVALHRGTDDSGQLCGKLGLDVDEDLSTFKRWGNYLNMKKYHLTDANGQVSYIERYHESRTSPYWYRWTQPSGAVLTWKNTGQLDIEDSTKRSRIFHGWKLVDESRPDDQVVCLFVYNRKWTSTQVGKIMISGYYENAPPEFEHGVLTSLLALVQLEEIQAQNAAAASSSSSSASVAAAISV